MSDIKIVRVNAAKFSIDCDRPSVMHRKRFDQLMVTFPNSGCLYLLLFFVLCFSFVVKI